jgi:glycosyltransferase involved in cell wall biosynthesis
MNPPEISVILPAYNTGAYLGKAIQSILDQSFSDFELLIINDGSTDKTEDIIRSFPDPRIVYIKNEQNCGLIYTLNKGIDISRGKYIARMDGDDICVKERLAVQKLWLDEHPQTAVLGCHIQYINERDEPAGVWPLEMNSSTAKSIRRILPGENCIAHPSVMGRALVFKQFLYKVYQENIEDYDLWLRLAASGFVIEKVDEPLLFYRIRTGSVTHQHLQKSNSSLKVFHCKRKFLYHRIIAGKFNTFDLKVLLYMIKNLGTGIAKMVKQG